jgi:hypothetical protein
MPATALVCEVESARESRPAELFAREQAVDLEFATSVNGDHRPAGETGEDGGFRSDKGHSCSME